MGGQSRDGKKLLQKKSGIMTVLSWFYLGDEGSAQFAFLFPISTIQNTGNKSKKWDFLDVA